MCHNLKEQSFDQWCWPDGKSGLSQFYITHQVFDIIKEQAENQIRKKMKAGNG